VVLLTDQTITRMRSYWLQCPCCGQTCGSEHFLSLKLFEVVYAFVVISLLDSVACSVNVEVATMSVVHALD
jgi:hypothetical protein